MRKYESIPKAIEDCVHRMNLIEARIEELSGVEHPSAVEVIGFLEGELKNIEKELDVLAVLTEDK